METNRIIVFRAAIIVTYLLVDIIKIMVAKQLKSRMTPHNIYKIKRVISIVLMIFGVFLIAQGIFPKEKEMIQEKLEMLKD